MLYTSLIIAGDGRKSGKTLLGCSVVQRLVENGHTVTAIKTSRADGDGHEEGFSISAGTAGSDTWRYDRAGARNVAIIRANDLRTLDLLAGRIERAEITVWESSRAGLLDQRDSMLVYISCGRDSTETSDSDLRIRADLLLNGPLEPGEELDRLARLTVDMMRSGVRECFSLQRAHWVGRGDDRLLGEGRASILEAVESAGSLLKASGITGIPYRRAWAIISRAEKELGARLIISKRGGRGGGGSELTRLGRELLQIYSSGEPDREKEAE